MKIDSVLADIEGTTTSIEFATRVLFPLSLQEIDRFVSSNWKSGLIADEIAALQARLAQERSISAHSIEMQDVIALLKEWIHADKKEHALKSIQGKIWKESFESGKLHAHVYPDVPRNFEKWKRTGIAINIFSSGSIEAQKLIFRYSEAGDLTRYINRYFDTSTGAKKEVSSYRSIASALGAAASNILFLSDVEAELDAAREAGMQTIQVVREEDAKPGTHPKISSFDEIHMD